MKLTLSTRLLSAAALGLAFSALVAHAQVVVVNLREQATFGSFVGGGPNLVTNNSTFNTTEVVTTGTSAGSPFSVTYTPFTGLSTVNLNTGTLNTATLLFTSPVTPLNYFGSTLLTINYDFDNNLVNDLTQNYIVSLSQYVSANGFIGVNYAIVPASSSGLVTINGTQYGYATAVSNSSGTLFNGSSTTAAIQFQFLTPVPEPSTYALAGVLALGGIVVLRRHHRPASGLMALAA